MGRDSAGHLVPLDLVLLQQGAPATPALDLVLLQQDALATLTLDLVLLQQDGQAGPEKHLGQATP